MLNKGEELYVFESEFFKITKKWFETDHVDAGSMEMGSEIDRLHRKYLGINPFYDEYVNSRVEWFIKMIVKKEKTEANK